MGTDIKRTVIVKETAADAENTMAEALKLAPL